MPNNVCVCVPVYMGTWMKVLKEARGVESPGIGISGSHEPPDGSDGN